MKYSNYFKDYNKSIYDLLNNFDTSLIDKSVELILDCQKNNGKVFNFVKDVNIPAGTSLEILSGGKVVLEATDEIKIDCSVADKISGTLSIMEIT